MMDSPPTMATPDSFDLTPDPRVLQMLGEINLAEWKCLAELIDNAVDGFLAALRADHYIQLPQVTVNIPTGRDVSAKVTVKDNGPGMSPETLERAVRAGFSGNDPINNLGLFGMGFNIATARLGHTTVIYSAREEDTEWSGLEINFDDLSRRRHFRTPRLTRPKAFHRDHGTEIIIQQLKPSVREYFAKSGSKTRIGKELSRVYSAMLRPDGSPIHFMLKLNGNSLTGRRHCVWDESRSVQVANFGEVSAIEPIDFRMDQRKFCLRCWQWLSAGENECLQCGSTEVVSRERRVHGWLGIQRYADTSEFGIDFLRNGRKIEIANKDLFSWRDGDSETDADVLEYPIDDPRGRGRMVGEIHLDHCRVAYTKDRFERNDVSWQQMVELVRGTAPLRPQKAADMGLPPNDSPLARLYRGFRRNNPQGTTSGVYARILVVKDNDRATEMAKKFHDGVPEYQTDDKWWALVEEADRELLISPGQRAGSRPSSLRDFHSRTSGDGSPGATTTTRDNDHPIGGSPSVTSVAPAANPVRKVIASLSVEYIDDITRQRWSVEAYDVLASDPQLSAYGEPWSIQMSASGVSTFYVNLSHSVFRSATFTPLDALLGQLAALAIDVPRSVAERPTYARVLSSLRAKYATQSRLDPAMLSAEANQTLVEIARGVAEVMDEGDGRLFFTELHESEQQRTQQRMATQSVPNPQRVIDDGRFLEYAPRAALLTFFEQHAELFFDGNYWSAEYETLDYGSLEATAEAKAQIVSAYAGLLQDAIWLDEKEPATLSAAAKPRLVRAAAALELLRRDSEESE